MATGFAIAFVCVEQVKRRDFFRTETFYARPWRYEAVRMCYYLNYNDPWTVTSRSQEPIPLREYETKTLL